MLNIVQGKYSLPPHILVMTETKLINIHTKQSTSWLSMMRKAHHMYHSAVPNTNSPQAGVTIAVEKEFVAMGTITKQPVEAALQGFLLHLTIQLPNSNPLHVLGVYCPPEYSSTTRTWCPIRLQLQRETTRILQAYPTTHHTVLVAGDFNAGKDMNISIARLCTTAAATGPARLIRST
jgi:exonuclease III